VEVPADVGQDVPGEPAGCHDLVGEAGKQILDDLTAARQQAVDVMGVRQTPAVLGRRG